MQKIREHRSAALDALRREQGQKSEISYLLLCSLGMRAFDVAGFDKAAASGEGFF